MLRVSGWSFAASSLNLERHIEGERLVILGIVTVNLERHVEGERLVIRRTVTVNLE
ncbi:hypothetical protein DPMN_109968 [Dreissena polymorpha]|uniref:Uncharacterized protein n=1 Tax=Dreissena polymorpha TaxID=45954 RepID=A0A9D4QNG2_DREPO|nr:hypothetical protein DPMN_109968 [Dreissena polymorpha]